MIDQLQIEYAALDARVTALERPMLTQLKTDYDRLGQRVSALEGNTPPTPVSRKLIGGWRLPNVPPAMYGRGAIAIDWARMVLYFVGHQQAHNCYSLSLSQPMGLGANTARWPEATWINVHPAWWNQRGYANGLCWWRGKLWAAIKEYYDTTPPLTTSIWAMDGEKIAIPLPPQQYNGFVKVSPGAKPFFGCGGYESGQGTALGPTMATIEGQPLISRPGPIGGKPWREKRPPNYKIDLTSEWVALEPDGDVGYWASDWLGGGGLVLPEGICYWAMLGVGPLSYAWQSYCFAHEWQTWKYVYDPITYNLKSYTHEPDLMRISGQEIDADGRVYLCQCDWEQGNYMLKVFA